RPAAPAALLSEEGGGLRVTLALGPEGAVARLHGGAEVREVATGAVPPLRCWMRLWLSVDPRTGDVVLGQSPWGTRARPAVARARLGPLRLPEGGSLLLAAENAAAPENHFTGRLEEPAILSGLREAWREVAAAPTVDTPGLVAAWNFAEGIPTQEIRDAGPQQCHGCLVNVPTRAVCGARWSGRETCWRHAPADYAAIHFHADDLHDCGWETSFRFEVPLDLPSGAYALCLTCPEGEDRLPFYVLPPRGTARPPVVFLAPTFTYQAYANHARGNADADYMARVAAWGAYPHNPDHVPAYGVSTYNRHPDRSGVAFSSRLRPVLTMRPGFLTFNDARGSGLRHYPADSHILAWLEARGIAYDIVTDEDLHEEGAPLLAPYRVLLTGTHPEYHTAETLDALTRFRDGGGRLMYLGGNGFYWRIACTPDMPGLIELRRAEGGIRSWDAEPGEYHHQLDGALGGLWRRNRRPPQMLAGVGFSAQGLFEGTHFRRLPASHTGRFAWMFDGIEEEVIGDHGLSGGGAAGFELDRADVALGTPEDAVILARSGPLPDHFIPVLEELCSHVNTSNGEPAAALRRGEIVAFEQPGGGAVFATGSITWCGSLWENGAFQGAVSRLTENVLRRFAAPGPVSDATCTSSLDDALPRAGS
ncbi:MAG TPA: N,N-dimethylformamidase beta subunit family domain-containing protein, partial [Acetobacteraceae bacterium]|nr:N,N-dimethylformamidase beta subunit family domain-containing protein [Acetobacteraceae bacterium]